MEFTRRSVLLGASLIAGTSRLYATELSGLTEDASIPDLPPELRQFSKQPSLSRPLQSYEPQGTEAPTSQEQVLADQVLANVPTNTTALKVASYFIDVGMGKYGEELKAYTVAWPVRWNPVIVEFFKVTKTQPSGDTTSWCAAFLNYCLIKAATGRTLPPGSSAPTHSASSGSFRTWAQSVDATAGQTAKPGDVVVFKSTNPAQAKQGKGHVGIFLGETDKAVLVLGGNQFTGSPVRHAVCRKAIPKASSSLTLFGYRTDPQLHE